MKVKRMLAAVVMALAMAFGANTASAQGGPGLVVQGSQTVEKLPSKAKSFINKHFKDVAVTKCQEYFAKGKYEVELRNGVDLEFDRNGKITEIDAPGNTTLASSVVKDILPSNAWKRLEKQGLTSSVESIEFKRGKVYEVELNIPSPDTYVFDINGTFLAIED